jgi:hypothetical protein
MTTSRTTTDSKRPSTWMLCAALAVVFGRGPVPWVHSHDMLAQHGHSEELLSWHVLHFHHADDGDEHCWHVHWTLPWQIVNCPCQHDNTSDQERASAVEMPFDVTQTASIDQSDLDVRAPLPLAILPASERATGPPGDWHAALGLHFLATYLPSVTVRALYCVALC